jgi:hypothetical protein
MQAAIMVAIGKAFRKIFPFLFLDINFIAELIFLTYRHNRQLHQKLIFHP